jgi:O-antigen ligase
LVEGFVWLGLDGVLSPAVTHATAAAFMLYAQGLLPFLLPLSVLLFEPTVKCRRRMLPFLFVGAGTALYILWALTAYSLQVYVKNNSIVYINPATNNTAVAVLYVIATCGSLFFSKIKDMIVFGAANLTILLVAMAVKRYAFTSVWCAYAAAASVIILVYFWQSKRHRPFFYAEPV